MQEAGLRHSTAVVIAFDRGWWIEDKKNKEIKDRVYIFAGMIGGFSFSVVIWRQLTTFLTNMVLPRMSELVYIYIYILHA